MVRQHIAEDGKRRPLSEFAQAAVTYLEEHPDCDEVVQLADRITELENGKINPPTVYHELPQGYEYNFSGFYGHVIGIGRTGIRELHRERPR